MEFKAQKKSRIVDALPSNTQLAMGLLAILVVQLFRPENTPLVYVLLECLFCLASPFVILSWMQFRQLDTDRKIKWNRSLAFNFLGLIFTVCPILTQFVLRALGYGDAYEVVAIMSILNLAWFFTVLSKVAGSENPSFVLNSSVVLFVCFATQAITVYVAAFLYSIIALWWLLENYWNRLIPKKLDAETSSLPIRGFAFGLSVVLLISVGMIAMAAGPVSNLIAVSGFMPSSGGEDGSDDMFARSGVGDGNMLTTGDRATSVGPLNTDQFIEGTQPSIYDVVSEKYDGPTKIRKKISVAQSLSEIAKHLHKVKQAEQAGRTFRTVRQSKKTFERKLEDRISDALFYLEGPAPTRFRVDCFQHFDGWDWTKSVDNNYEKFLPEMTLETHHEIPWFVLQFDRPEFLGMDRHHKIKILRLDTAALPAAPFIKAWHIDKVDQEKFFKFNDFGMIEIRRDKIPSQTVVDTISHQANRLVLRNANLERFHSRADPLLTQVPDNATAARVKALAKSLTQGIDPGWRQVEAITRHVRSSYQLDDSDVPDEDCADTVGWFLDNEGGPSYLFATTAIQLLRSAGYETRLASGFVVRQKDYDYKSGQSIVAHENYHVWPEVCVDGCHWIAIEPTPGFDDPVGVGTLLQRALNFFYEGYLLAKRYPVGTVCLVLSLGLVVYIRRYWMAFFVWCHWKTFGWISPKTRLRMTRQLIDARLWLFGVPRPSFVAIRDWFGKVDGQLSSEFFDIWNRIQFRSGSADKNVQPKQVETACNHIVSQLSLSKIKKFAEQKND